MEGQSEKMKGKVVLITGATSGIGRATAMGLGPMGAKLVLVGRNKERLDGTIDEIAKRTGNKDLDMLVCDLSSMQNVRQLVNEYKQKYQRLDVLINNAGTIVGKRKTTVDGFEYTFALNHLSPFLLTNLLLDTIKVSAPARIINVSSAAHASGHIHFDDLMLERNYSPFRAYGQSKLANVLFTHELAQRLQGTRVTANCLHPGAVRTHFGNELGRGMRAAMPLFRPFMIGPEKGAETSVYLASSPEVENITGMYFAKKREKESSHESYDEAEAKRLWEISAKLTKLE